MSIRKTEITGSQSTDYSPPAYANKTLLAQRRRMAETRARSFGLTSDSDFMVKGQEQKANQALRLEKDRKYAEQKSGRRSDPAFQGQNETAKESDSENGRASAPQYDRLALSSLRGFDRPLAEDLPNEADVELFELLLSRKHPKEKKGSDSDATGLKPENPLCMPVLPTPQPRTSGGETSAEPPSTKGSADSPAPVSAAKSAVPMLPDAAQSAPCDPVGQKGEAVKHEGPWLLSEGSHFQLTIQTRDLGPLQLTATQTNGGWRIRLSTPQADQVQWLRQRRHAIARGLSRDLNVPVELEVDE